jgi:succinate dehydrogenase hydrophobic anchor subunit
MIVCFLHAKVGHRQAIYLDYLNVVKQTLSMKIVRVFAFKGLGLSGVI